MIDLQHNLAHFSNEQKKNLKKKKSFHFIKSNSRVHDTKKWMVFKSLKIN